MLCLLGSDAARVFSLRVELTAPLRAAQSASPVRSGSPVHIAETKQVEPSSVESFPDVDDPYNFTDEDIDEMIAILQRPVAPPAAPPVPLPPLLSPDTDADLWGVLGMDVSDFSM